MTRLLLVCLLSASLMLRTAQDEFAEFEDLELQESAVEGEDDAEVLQEELSDEDVDLATEDEDIVDVDDEPIDELELEQELEAEETEADVEQEVIEEPVMDDEQVADDEDVSLAKDEPAQELAEDVDEPVTEEEPTEELIDVAPEDDEAVEADDEDLGVDESVIEEEPIDVAIEEDELAVAEDEVVIPATVVQEQLEDEEDEIQGITTIDLDEPRGNWLFKRIWWERSEGRYEKIRTLLNGINETRIYFFTQSIDLDKTILDPFYQEINFERGTLHTLLEELEQRLTQERVEDGMLDVQEREVLDKVEQEKTMLLQLQEDVKAILAMDNKVNDVLGRVMDQMQRVNKYERDAWESMKEIARILDDIQARDLYYKVDTAWRNVKEVARYLDAELKRHFDELVATTKEQIERVKTTLSALQERGVLLKQEAQALDDYETMIEAQEEIEIVDEESTVEKQPLGWVDWIGSWFTGTWQWLTSWF